MVKEFMREVKTVPPLEKEILNSGMIIIREGIDATIVDNFLVYTWLETRYSQLEYMQVIEQENELFKKENNKLWDTVGYLLKATGCVPEI